MCSFETISFTLLSVVSMPRETKCHTHGVTYYNFTIRELDNAIQTALSKPVMISDNVCTEAIYVFSISPHNNCISGINAALGY